jgi:hypothetical protein
MTADWMDTPPATRSWTRLNRMRHAWGARKVRPNGTVRWRGRNWRPATDVQVLPLPGEWLLFCDYGPEHPPTAYEWTAPADPDNHIRRMFWVEASA